MKNTYTKKQRKMIAAGKRISIVLFGSVMAIGFLTGLLFFARPSVSAIEMRTLTAFPAFSLSSFLDGSWFSEISTWYSDTYPGRDVLIAMNHKIASLYGLTMETQVYGGGSADEIPQDTAEQSSDDSSQTDSTTQAEAKKTYTQMEIPENYDVNETVQAQVMEGLLVQNGAVYGGYYFNYDAVQAYIDVVDRAAQQLAGTTQVYSVLVPCNSALLDEETLNGLGGSNQKQAIDYYYSHYSDLVHPVDVIDKLLEHKGEYLYFRTDHHWTTLGAYYAYTAFCEAKGIEPKPLDYFQTETYSPYYGSYSRQLDAALTADEVTVYVPRSTNTLQVCMPDENGEITTACAGGFREAPVVSLYEGIDEYNQYMRFIQGDQGFEVIDNPEIEDGSSCLVIKESYGNAFVPFLVDHYDKVYVVDFRYNDGTLLDFCRDNKVQDLILVSNIQIIGGSNVPAVYDRLLQ